MIFHKNPPVEEPEQTEDVLQQSNDYAPQPSEDMVETVVGPSVNVEGDFASEGNIVVKGTVSGSVRTSRHLTVETGAKVMANVKAGTAQVAGEVMGNVKVKGHLSLAATARVVGDIDAGTLSVEEGAMISGRISMPGFEGMDKKKILRFNKKPEAMVGA